MVHRQTAPKVIVVAGDVTMDWHLVRQRRAPAGVTIWNPDDGAHAHWQRGGAALLADLIEVVADTLHQAGGGECVLRQVDVPREPVCPDDARFHHAYALWSRLGSGDQAAWRVAEFLGLARSLHAGPRVMDDDPAADLVVLDDANLGFRNQPDWWPQALTDERRPPWVVLKMAQPVAQGRLWDHLLDRLAGRLVVVTTVNDLRRTEVQISQGLSWERTAQDVAWELVHNPRVNGLARCAAVVVSFGPAGAVWLSRLGLTGSATPACWLLFDPEAIEDQWAQQYPGGMVGGATCLTAGIVRQLMIAPDQPDLQHGIQSGLTALRRLYRDGYEPEPLRFPHDLIAAELAGGTASLAVAQVQDPVRFLVQPAASEAAPADGFWTILQDRYRTDLHRLAQQIALEGGEVALRSVPLGRFGHLLTVDRREIESLRSISALVDEYLSQDRPPRPLSIAVFGPPGSGKSFGITQMAQSLAPGRIAKLEFNLSQFESADELAAALHQVRDVGLSGQVPLVFWDEFDTPLAGQPLGWLRYFLAPMQDGSFREGQIVHPIGRAIFVFAGGTSHRMATFGHALDPAEARTAKLPDFVSRLKGYVDVRGPNRQSDEADPHYIIRRAILLRSILQRHAPPVFHKQGGKTVLAIDRGVLRAFLETREYRHGARSMEAICAMSQLAGETTFERSSLPAEAQLDLHVDGRDFLALVQRPDLDGELLEKLAMAAHEVFCEGLQARGYRWGSQTDELLQTHQALVPYANLSAELQEQNRANVRDIPAKLAYAGYVMAPARSNEPSFDFPGDDLERLAELEHERWLAAKQSAGWRPGPALDPVQKIHPYLVPWTELSEPEKEKDRDLVRGIPRILAQAGYAILRSRAIAGEE